MRQPGTQTVRLKVSSQVAGIIGPGAPRTVQLAAAQGAVALSGADLLTVLCVLCASADGEVKQAALGTLRSTPGSVLLPVLDEPSLHPRLLDLLARVRSGDHQLQSRIIAHPGATDETVCYLAQLATGPVLDEFLTHRERLTPTVIAALRDNPLAAVLLRTGPIEAQADAAAADLDQEKLEPFPEAVDGNPEDLEEISDEALAAHLLEAEQQGMTKYQLALELKVSEKIKLAMTGDAEWRKILLKDPNRMVHGAVLKNARITEAEVVMVARNRSASDEMVRLILLNRDWMKNYEIRKALVVHPKTPLPKALRCVADLSLRDLKDLMRNRNVTSVLAGAARREFERKNQRGG